MNASIAPRQSGCPTEGGAREGGGGAAVTLAPGGGGTQPPPGVPPEEDVFGRRAGSRALQRRARSAEGDAREDEGPGVRRGEGGGPGTLGRKPTGVSKGPPRRKEAPSRVPRSPRRPQRPDSASSGPCPLVRGAPEGEAPVREGKRRQEGALESAGAAGTHRAALAGGPSPSPGAPGVTSGRSTPGTGAGERTRAQSWDVLAGAALRRPAQTPRPVTKPTRTAGGGQRQDVPTARGEGRHHPEVQAACGPLGPAGALAVCVLPVVTASA